MKTLLTIILFTSLGLCISCDLGLGINEPTELEKLPPLTTTGENTFGCLVNGEAFVVTNTSHVVAVYQGGGLSISGGIQVEGNFQSIEVLVADDMSINSSFILTNDTNHKGQFYDEDSLCFFYTNSDNQGTLFISFFDPDHFIVSGTFHFHALSGDCEDSIVVTDGRFDIQYIP